MAKYLYAWMLDRASSLAISRKDGKVTIEITGQPAIAVSPERALEYRGINLIRRIGLIPLQERGLGV